MNGPCDAAANYVLFASGSSNLTREWARSEDSGRIACQPKSQEKLKYYVLKNPPATAPKPPSRVPGSSSFTVLSLGQLKTVKLNGRLYSIDPAIYPEVNASLQTNPVTTSCELQARIEQIRTLLNKPAPLGVQLAKVGLSNYKKRYTYLTAGSTFPQISSKLKAALNRVFDAPLQTAEYARDVIVYSEAYHDYRPLTQTAQWVDIFIPQSEQYLPLFPGSAFIFDDAQFIRVTNNNGCTYTGDVTQIFPGGSASLFGVKVLTNSAIENYFKTKDETFIPLACTLTPNSNPSQGGLLLPKRGMLVKILRPGVVVELIFVPAETELEMIQNTNWPVGAGLTIETI